MKLPSVYSVLGTLKSFLWDLCFIQHVAKRWPVAKKAGKQKKKGKMNKQKGVGREGALPVCLTIAAHPTSSSSKQGNGKSMSQRASATQLTAPSGHYLTVGEAAVKCGSWAAETLCYFST